MTRLASVITEAIVHEYGRDEMLRRLAHLFWFQSFGAVMGMEWHSSGITTGAMPVRRFAHEAASRDSWRGDLTYLVLCCFEMTMIDKLRGSHGWDDGLRPLIASTTAARLASQIQIHPGRSMPASPKRERGRNHASGCRSMQQSDLYMV
jgi:Protein of unknown function (DUF763)